MIAQMRFIVRRVSHLILFLKIVLKNKQFGNILKVWKSISIIFENELWLGDISSSANAEITTFSYWGIDICAIIKQEDRMMSFVMIIVHVFFDCLFVNHAEMLQLFITTLI